MKLTVKERKSHISREQRKRVFFASLSGVGMGRWYAGQELCRNSLGGSALNLNPPKVLKFPYMQKRTSMYTFEEI